MIAICTHDYTRLLDSPMDGRCGVGELAPPVVLAAAANALSRLAGRRIRTLPVIADRTMAT